MKAVSVESKIKRIRLSHDLTIEDLSPKLNIHKEKIQEYENGVTALSYDDLNKYNKFFKVSLDFLLDTELVTEETFDFLLSDQESFKMLKEVSESDEIQKRQFHLAWELITRPYGLGLVHKKKRKKGF